MAYNDDAVLARLSALNESHDSIATAAQWIMFHRRHADRTVQLWMQRLKDSSSTKRLMLIYLANEVAQQSRIRHKEDFIIAFSPAIAEAVSIAYKGAPTEVQSKIRRVVDVWRDRNIFESSIQKAMDSRLEELDKARGSSKTGFGGNPFGSAAASIPSEFTSLISAHQSVSKLATHLKSTIASADQEYDKQTDTSTPAPSAPVYAARLNGLLRTLANAENAVADCVRAREGLVSGLEKLLEAHRTALESDRQSVEKLGQRKHEIEEKKQKVEFGIMQALGSVEQNGAGADGTGHGKEDEERPQMEALTPEMEAFTPPSGDIPPMEALPPTTADEQPVGGSGIEVLSNAASSYQSLPISSNGSNKKRRWVDEDEDIHGVGGDDAIDADVAAMLQEGSKA